jgi:hypothetical protein
MKPKLLYSSLALILFFFINISITHAQDWSWRWANSCSSHFSNETLFESVHIDYLNNVYGVIPYTSAVHVGDTILTVTGEFKGRNYGIAKYSSSGNFIEAMCCCGASLWELKIVADKSSNIYIGGEFNQVMRINDSLFHKAEGSSPEQPEVFIAKLSSDFTVKYFGLIHDITQDMLKGLVISEDDYLYVSTYHYANNSPVQVYYLNQYISEPFNAPMSTIIKLDTNLNIKWIKEIRSLYLGTEAEKLFIGDDGQIYLFGNGLADFYVDSDTIYHPDFNIGTEAVFKNFLLAFDSDGNLQDGHYLDWDIGISYQQIDIDINGNLFLSGTLHDTAVIGQDTIIVPEGLYHTYYGKFNQSLEPIWYEVIEETATSAVGFNTIDLLNENILLGGYGSGNFQIDSTVFSFGNYWDGIVCEFDPSGNLKNYITTNSNKDLFIRDFAIDNCNNLVVCGYFHNKAIFGNDTLLVYSNDIDDGFISKIGRIEQVTIELGPDTMACELYTIYGPLGYIYYSWNNTITNQSSYTTTETGTIAFACANEEGCWLYDTINVTIHPGFEINLGSDTTISENESIVFTVPEGYESYLWSNSVTAISITVFGESYEPGTILPVWVRVTDGPCIISDTVLVAIKSEFAVEDFSGKSISLYPNPFNDCIYINSGSEINQIDILSLQGLCLISKEILNPDREIIKIHLEDLKQGVYFLKLISGESESIKKIVKL